MFVFSDEANVVKPSSQRAKAHYLLTGGYITESYPCKSLITR